MSLPAQFNCKQPSLHSAPSLDMKNITEERFRMKMILRFLSPATLSRRPNPYSTKPVQSAQTNARKPVVGYGEGPRKPKNHVLLFATHAPSPTGRPCAPLPRFGADQSLIGCHLLPPRPPPTTTITIICVTIPQQKKTPPAFIYSDVRGWCCFLPFATSRAYFAMFTVGALRDISSTCCCCCSGPSPRLPTERYGLRILFLAQRNRKPLLVH